MKVHFITQGCSANVADSEVMAGLLQEEGFLVIDEPEHADLFVYNTCTVKGPTESFFNKKLKELKDLKKPVIIAGCIPQSMTKKEIEKYKNFSLIGTYQIKEIVPVVKNALKGKTTINLKRNNESRLNTPKIRKNNLVEIVPISHGCLSTCTYCKTKHARGQLYSYKAEEIVRHISKAVENGAKEIWLTSQDSSAYGLDIKTNIAELLKKIVSIKRDFKLRLGMANPLFITEFLDDFIEVFKDEKIYKFLHMPVQCGSNKVLKDMKRGYTVDEFKFIVDEFKKKIPELTLATDIICGFPSETDEDFKETVKIIKETRPDVINISRFWPRPGTPAASMKPVNGKIVKQRTNDITKLHEKISTENNKNWLGWKGKILISEKGKNNVQVGRNFAYKQVLIKDKKDLVSKELEVEIKDTGTYDLRC